MILPRRLAILLIGFSFAPSVRADDSPPAPIDPAELLPKDTFFYAEVSQPGPFAQEVRTLLEGSALENIVEHTDQLRQKHPGEYLGLEDISLIGSMLGPEAAAEAARLESVLFAIVPGIDNEPEPMLIVRTGSSNLPGFAMRSFLSGENGPIKIADVGEVSIYQENPDPYGYYGGGMMFFGGPVGPDEEEPTQPVERAASTYAHAPGTVIIGFSRVAVVAVLERLQSLGEGESLTSAEGFPTRDVRNAHPGVFVYIDCTQLAHRIDQAFVNSDASLTPIEWELTKELLNPRAIQRLSGGLAPAGGSVSLNLKADLAPDEMSPLAELCAGGRVHIAEVPGEPLLALTLTLPPEGRSERFLRVADACVRATGTLGMHPGEAVAMLKETVGIDLTDGVLNRIESLSVVLPQQQTIPEGEPLLPTLIIRADAPAAESLEKLFPALVSLVTGEPADAVTETVDGQVIRSLPANATPWGGSLRFGRRDGMLVFGPDSDVVLSLLKTEQNSVEMGPAVVANWRWSAMLPDVLAETFGPPSEEEPVVEEFFPFGGFGGIFPIFGGEEEAEMPSEEGSEPESIRELRAVLPEVPPLELSLSRDAEALRIQIRQPELSKVSPRLVDGWVEWKRQQDLYSNGYYPGYWGRW